MRLIHALVRLLAGLGGLALAPATALALQQRTIMMTTGIRVDYATALSRLVNFLAISSISVATTIFVVGAFMVVASAGEANLGDRGKNLMKRSLIGMVIILCSYSILRTVLYIIYVI